MKLRFGFNLDGIDMNKGYKTKQKASILEYLKAADGHVTADDVVNYFRNSGNLIGKATVYRYLDKLTEQNVVLKFSAGNGQSACYQYVGEHEAEPHYHLICVKCGELIHEKCGYMDEVAKHLSINHKFVLDPLKTVLYGKCKNCQ